MKKLVVLTALVFSGILLGTMFYRPVQSAGPLNLSLVSFASGFSDAVDIVSAGDDRLFVVEQSGFISIVQPNGTVLAEKFLNINGSVLAAGEDGAHSEQGLLSLAFHPNYATNGYFYVFYTRDADGSGDGDVVISRFSVSSNSDIASSGSEQVLMVIGQPYQNHNGGSLEFGSDGFLYISTGDGGSGGDPLDAGQSKETLLGKILRIDVDGASPGAPDTCSLESNIYTIPESNPEADGAGGDCDEIWALGLRNPFRFAFDSLTGDMFIGDVGQALREEVNFQPAASIGGENYGWDCYEGNLSYNDPSQIIPCGDIGDYVFPIFDFVSTGNCSVIGGEVYRGSIYPEMYGHYLFTDYCSGQFWDAVPAGGGNWTVTELADLGGSFRSFGIDNQGEIYLTNGSTVFHVVEDTVATPTPPPPTPTPMNLDADFGLNLVEVADGFNSTSVIAAADGPNLFVAEREGNIWRIDPSSAVTPTLILNFSDEVDDSGFQEGLLGVVKDPDFETNGLIYINYTDLFSNTVVSRFAITDSLPIDPDNEDVILTLPQPFTDNNGGGLAFGPDGFLYIALGDGGNIGDPDDLAQNPFDLHGKILRIDVHNAGTPPDCGVGAYTIPGSNPNNGSTGCKEIWQLGFRNIWGLSFDSQTGDLWIADVGDQKIEEINRQPASSIGGQNYGWSCYEGSETGPNYDAATCTAAYVFPFHEYDHGEGRSVTGGYVYRGSQYPAMQGYYFFADFVYGKLWSMDIDTAEVIEHYAQLGSWGALGQSNDGTLYIADYGNGKIYRIEGYDVSRLMLPVILNQ